jgi:hypothetical protein
MLNVGGRPAYRTIFRRPSISGRLIAVFSEPSKMNRCGFPGEIRSHAGGMAAGSFHST